MFLVSLVLLMSSSLLMGSAHHPLVDTDGKLQTILPVVNQKVTYTDVVDCGSVSQADLFRRARLWVVQSGRFANDPFSLSDKETGDLAGQFTQTILLPRTENAAGAIYTFRYNYIIECANRKYRVTLTQIDLDEGNSRYVPIETFCQRNEKNLQTVCLELDKQLKGVLTALQESVRNYKAF